MTMQVALLRGVNVGGAKKVAMADLKAMVEALGFTQVKTLLQSGNVVFDSQDLAAIRAVATPGEKVEAVDRCVYIFFGDGIADSKAAVVFGKKSLGMTATGRNWNTVMKIAALIGA